MLLTLLLLALIKMNLEPNLLDNPLALIRSKNDVSNVIINNGKFLLIRESKSSEA